MMMDDNMQSAKKYAVVKFKLDSTYSEIPAIWLMENVGDGQWCLWPPRTANNATLISNYAIPNYDTWVRYEIEIIKFCSSLESAQKNAADANHQTTNKKRLEKAKRQHVSYNHYSSEEEEYETSPQARKRNKIKEEENEKENFLEVNENLVIEHMPIIIEGCNVTNPTSTQNIEDLDIKQNIEKILRMQAAANTMLKDINQRLTKIETAFNFKNHVFNVVENNENNAFIEKFLPLTSIDSIRKFDVLLKTTDEAVRQFKEFISKIGGNNPKNNIHRSLKKVFTNECAMNCSWKGLRNNFRIADLYITKLMRREIISRNMGLTESEFDNVTAEWLRFAKQRKERYDKATRNEEDNRTN